MLGFQKISNKTDIRQAGAVNRENETIIGFRDCFNRADVGDARGSR